MENFAPTYARAYTKCSFNITMCYNGNSTASREPLILYPSKITRDVINSHVRRLELQNEARRKHVASRRSLARSFARRQTGEFTRRLLCDPGENRSEKLE